MDDTTNEAIVVLSACFGERSIGITIISTEEASCYVNVFNKGEIDTLMFNLSMMYGITHIVVPADMKDKLNDIMANIPDQKITPQPRSSFTVEEGLSFLDSVVLLVPENERDDSKADVKRGILSFQSDALLASLGAVSKFLEQRTETHIRICSFRSIKLSGGLYVGKRAYEDLAIISIDPHPSIYKTQLSKIGLSLFSFLNRCSTPMGVSVLRKYFYLTTTDFEEVRNRLNTIEILVDPPNHRFVNQMILYLRKIGNVTNLLARMSKGCLLKSVYAQLTSSVNQAHQFIQYVLSNPLWERIQPSKYIFTSDTLKLLYEISTQLQSVFDFTPSKRLVREIYDRTLDDMYEKYENLDELLNETAIQVIQRVNSSNPLKSLSVVFTPNLGYFVAVVKDPEVNTSSLPADFIVHHETETHIFCRTAETQRLDSVIGDIPQQIQRREIEIIVHLSNAVYKYAAELQQIWDSLGEIDALCSLVVVSIDSNFTKPEFSTDGSLLIRNGRHPLIEKLNDFFVPNTTFFQIHEPKTHVITGPNSSGKSVYLKQVGLIVFMAHIGCFVPADEARIPLLDEIITIFHGQDYVYEPFSSSFTAELNQMAHAVNCSTPNTLCLFDEFGKTTDADDGGSLLCALIDHFNMETRPFVIFSTHFYHLLNENYLNPNAYVHWTMTINFEENHGIVFLYKLGKATNEVKSLGKICASRSGIPEEVIRRAQGICDSWDSGLQIEPLDSANFEMENVHARSALAPFFGWSKETNPKDIIGYISTEFS